MVDKSKGFEILQNTLDIRYHSTLDGNRDRFTYYDSTKENNGFRNDFILNEYESSILNDCLESYGDEPDSIEKILSDAKKMGWDMKRLLMLADMKAYRQEETSEQMAR